MMMVKYFFVILMCDFATLDDRVTALTSVLVHQHHGMFLRTTDMNAIDNYAARKKAKRAEVPAAPLAADNIPIEAYGALGGVNSKYIP
jgi:hypothetical protein